MKMLREFQKAAGETLDHHQGKQMQSLKLETKTKILRNSKFERA